MGVTGLETAFPVLYTDLVLPGRARPRPAGGAHDAPAARPTGCRPPTLAQGAPADLCLVDLEAAWTVGEAGYESRSENSCFAGRELRGRVLMTVARGRGRLPRAGLRDPAGGRSRAARSRRRSGA